MKKIILVLIAVAAIGIKVNAQDLQGYNIETLKEKYYEKVIDQFEVENFTVDYKGSFKLGLEDSEKILYTVYLTKYEKKRRKKIFQEETLVKEKVISTAKELKKTIKLNSKIKNKLHRYLIYMEGPKRGISMMFTCDKYNERPKEEVEFIDFNGIKESFHKGEELFLIIVFYSEESGIMNVNVHTDKGEEIPVCNTIGIDRMSRIIQIVNFNIGDTRSGVYELVVKIRDYMGRHLYTSKKKFNVI